MSALTPLNLADRSRNDGYFDKSRDMETALAWNAVKKTLKDAGRDDLFAYIQSVKVTEKSIIIKTEKPIIMSELQGLRTLLVASLRQSAKTLKNNREKQLRII